MMRSCLLVATLACGVLSVSLRRENVPVQPNGHIIEPEQPDYTYGAGTPTFTDDSEPHTFKTIEGLGSCEGNCGEKGVAVQEFGGSPQGLIEVAADPYDPTFTVPGGDDHTVLTLEPSECAHCGGSAEGGSSLIQKSTKKDDPYDPTFTSSGPVAPCNCPDKHTIISVEPTECAHCGGSGESSLIQTGSGESSLIQIGSGESSLIQTGSGESNLIQKSAKKDDPYDPTFTSSGPVAPCNCPDKHTIISVEPTECAHCGGSAESGASLIQVAAKKQDPNDRDFVDPGPNGPIIYTEGTPPAYTPPSYTIESTEPSVCAHCSGASSE